MNFNIDLTTIGHLPMGNIILLGAIGLAFILAWRLPELIEQWRKFNSGGQ